MPFYIKLFGFNPARKQHLLMEASQTIAWHPCPVMGGKKKKEKQPRKRLGLMCFGLGLGFFSPQDCGEDGGKEQVGMPGLNLLCRSLARRDNLGPCPKEK